MHVDSLFVYSQGKQKSYPLITKYRTDPPQGMFDAYNANEYRRRYCEYQYFSKPFYDRVRNVIYVTSANPTPYEKRDGTLADELDKPTSLIVLDSNFKQLAEIDIPNEFWYNSILISKGIGYCSKKLSNDNRMAFVIFELRKNGKAL